MYLNCLCANLAYGLPEVPELNKLTYLLSVDMHSRASNGNLPPEVFLKEHDSRNALRFS